MTITLHWLLIPVALVIFGGIGFATILYFAEDYDLYAGFIAFSILGFGVGAAIFFTLGKLF